MMLSYWILMFQRQHKIGTNNCFNTLIKVDVSAELREQSVFMFSVQRYKAHSTSNHMMV